MASPGNLPPQLTSFIGRERELAEVKRLLGRARLLTLTGPGGAGKTRLALRVADDLSAAFPAGIWFVELAALVDPALVPQAVAVAVGAREEPGRPLLTTLGGYFASRTALLILDNCEHLAAACAALVDALLRACPNLKVLATSRQPLGVGGEVGWPLPALATPDPAQTHAPVDLLGYAAVQLFVERAQLGRPDFVVTAQNGPAVAMLTRSLDGIPLALELAAARVKVLSVEGIVARLDERFRLLAAPNSDLAPRRQTLQALMDWSYDLLSEEEQALFRSLAVFAGSFSLAAVRAVAPGNYDEIALIELLSRLSDKSLLLVEDNGGEARYRLLETIREYARQRLAATGDLAALRRRHRDFYLELVEASEDELISGRQADWLERLEVERDNLRVALDWSRQTALADSGEAAGALRLAGGLVWFWYFHGYLSEGRESLEGALATVARGTPERNRFLAKTLNAAGALAFLQSDYSAARPRLEESLSIWREVGDERGVGFALAFLARTVARQGDTSGRALGEESASIFRTLSEKWGLALTLDFLGELAREAGDSAAAASYHGDSLALYRDLGHKWGIALELSNLGRLALAQRDYALARQRLAEAMAIQRSVGDKWSLAWTLQALGATERAEGAAARARELYAESLALFEDLGERGGIARARQNLDELATAAPVPANDLPADLTRREAEVLRLVAAGLTDAQIAARLYLSTRTVQAHLRSIYSKLDVTSRSAATRFAMEHQLG